MSTNLTQLRKVLSKVGPLSCPNEVNLHCHTICSDGSLTPRDLIIQATNMRIRHIAVTDHHSISAYPDMYDWLEKNRSLEELPMLWTGIEISCLLKKTLVHVIGLGFDLTNKSIYPYIQGEATIGMMLNAIKVVEAIHNAGGLAILAHPARYRISFAELIDEAYKIGFDGVESWYDYEHSLVWKPTELICDSIEKLAKKYNLLSTCGTDTHGKYLYTR